MQMLRVVMPLSKNQSSGTRKESRGPGGEIVFRSSYEVWLPGLKNRGECCYSPCGETALLFEGSREWMSAVRGAGKRRVFAAAGGPGKEIRKRESTRYGKQRLDRLGSGGTF